MITRLKIKGFKNLVDVDVHFGPFTCIAGANGVGKSNLFDAICFLSALADKPFVEAAQSVREEKGIISDIRSLFFNYGGKFTNTLSFEVEMIIPKEGIDDLGQKAEATITFLKYTLEFKYRKDKTYGTLSPLELLKEELVHIKRGEAHKHLLFNHNKKNWRDSAVTGRRSGKEFISTEIENGKKIVKLHQDGSGGRTSKRQAMELPRTVLSATNAAESPTALLVKKEMQSWKLLQLEPSALRKPDEISAPAKLTSDGSHLPSTLFRLSKHNKFNVYDKVANRLSELIDDVQSVSVDEDYKRELLTLFVTDKYNSKFPARSLSDGTLRFLALAVLEQDPEALGVICMEEPENGIHPERIPSMIELLQDIATDVDEEVGIMNPLRQVIINTHSPAFVQQVPEDSLLTAELREMMFNNEIVNGARFCCLPENWRTKSSVCTCPMGLLLSYLNPVILEDSQKKKRVIDNKDVLQYAIRLND